ncbi:MAG: aminodeoxychorismate synthase component I [Phycisphaerae bacterium]
MTVRCLDAGPTVDSAVTMIAAEPGGFALESTAAGPGGGRYSILGCDPVAEFVMCDGETQDWLDRLTRQVGPADLRYRHPDLPLVGGWIGFITYEAGPALESLICSKPRDIALPAVYFSLYDTLAVFDHHTGVWWITAVDLPNCSHRPPASRRMDRLITMLQRTPAAPPVDWSRSVADEPRAVMSPGDYFDRLAAAKRYISAGDIYQVNLTQRFTARTDASPVELYRRLRIANPGAYSALFTYGDSAVLSASPELFLTLRDGVVVTRPIKGTRPRTGDPVLDDVRSWELLHSDKDRAELTMIVDLLRNDLGRVSEFGSVTVVSPGSLEAHPTVFHLVGTVRGKLRQEFDWADLMRASFPGGSITGCPKIRAMQIIDEIEATQRNVYCGSIGYIGLDGSMCLNIAIRTMVLDRGRLHLFGGGAIVADSQPEEEYEEILAKTEGMMRALRAGEPGKMRVCTTRERRA